MSRKAVVAEWKKKFVKNYSKLISDYPIIGVVDMQGLPAAQLQKMRSQLRGKVVLVMGKKSLFKLALSDSKNKEGVDKLSGYLRGMPALLFTKENPFLLYKILQKSKSNAPAKAGSVAPKDIVVTAGPTPFAPGPIIGELGQIGVKAGIEGGKVAIKEDSVVAKEGQVINAQLAGILTRLGIQPMEIGLNLVAAYEGGSIFDRKILAVDEQEYINNITGASRWAFNLAMDIAYPSTQTTELLLQKAFKDGKALAMEANVLNDATVSELLVKAERGANALKSNVPDAPVEDKKEKKISEEKEEKAEESEKKGEESGEKKEE